LTLPRLARKPRRALHVETPPLSPAGLRGLDCCSRSSSTRSGSSDERDEFLGVRNGRPCPPLRFRRYVGRPRFARLDQEVLPSRKVSLHRRCYRLQTARSAAAPLVARHSRNKPTDEPPLGVCLPERMMRAFIKRQPGSTDLVVALLKGSPKRSPRQGRDRRGCGSTLVFLGPTRRDRQLRLNILAKSGAASGSS